MALGKAEANLLKRYPRAIAHMHWQLRVQRLVVVFGAGASKDLGFPTWKELVERVTLSPDVKPSNLTKEVRKPLPIIAEAAFHVFRQSHLEEIRKLSPNANDIDRLLTSRWVDLIHQCLYDGVPEEMTEILKRDTVYQHLIPVVRASPITVNYNYDDTLQRILLHMRPSVEADRGFETVTDPNLPHSPHNTVLYHPNGFLPRNLLERTTDKIIFNEGTFAHQISDFMMGTFSSMLHHLSQRTNLFVGLSLDDETLRHMLHRSAILNPGHYHYHVEHCSSAVECPTPAMRAQAAANFETYNLITLFLNSADIAALGHCLAEKPEDIRAFAEESDVRLSYTYYLVGVPGIGKTTTLSHFKDLTTWDEWLEERLPEMGKPFLTLTEEERLKVDTWIMNQVALKNLRLLDAERKDGIGVTIVDRCVPDAVTFTQPEGWSEKAQSLLNAVSPGASKRKVYPGHVIFLAGDPKEIKIRADLKHREAGEKYIIGMQRALEIVYGKDGVTKVDANGLTIAQVIKEVARLVHLGEYSECNLHKRLEDIRDGLVRNTEPIELG
jgi:hypothetical protein